jgi:hypothetical protein
MNRPQQKFSAKIFREHFPNQFLDDGLQVALAALEQDEELVLARLQVLLVLKVVNLEQAEKIYWLLRAPFSTSQ